MSKATPLSLGVVGDAHQDLLGLSEQYSFKPQENTLDQKGNPVPGMPFNVYSNTAQIYNKMVGEIKSSNPALWNNPFFQRELGKHLEHANMTLMENAINDHAQALSFAVKNQAATEWQHTLDAEFAPGRVPDYAGLTQHATESLYRAGIKNPGEFLLQQVQTGVQRRLAEGDTDGAKDYLDKASQLTIGTAKISEGAFADDYQKMREHVYHAAITQGHQNEADRLRQMNRNLDSNPEVQDIASSVKDSFSAFQKLQGFVGKITANPQAYGIRSEDVPEAISRVTGMAARAAGIGEKNEATLFSRFQSALKDPERIYEADILQTLVFAGPLQQQALDYREKLDRKVAPMIEGAISKEFSTLHSFVHDLRDSTDSESVAALKELSALEDNTYTSITDGLLQTPDGGELEFRRTTALPMVRDAVAQAQKVMEKLNKRGIEYSKEIEETYAKKNDLSGFEKIRDDIANGVISEKSGSKAFSQLSKRLDPVVKASPDVNRIFSQANIEASQVITSPDNNSIVSGKISGQYVQLGLIEEDPNKGKESSGFFGTTPAPKIMLTAFGRQTLADRADDLGAAYDEWTASEAGQKANTSPQAFMKAARAEARWLDSQFQKHMEKDPTQPFKPYAKTSGEPQSASPANSASSETSAKPTEEKVPEISKQAVGARDVKRDQRDYQFAQSTLLSATKAGFNTITDEAGTVISSGLPQFNLGSLYKDAATVGQDIFSLLENPFKMKPVSSAAIVMRNKLSGSNIDYYTQTPFFVPNKLLNNFSRNDYAYDQRPLHPQILSGLVLTAAAKHDPALEKLKDFTKQQTDKVLGFISEMPLDPREKEQAVIDARMYTGVHWTEILKQEITTNKKTIAIRGTNIPIAITPIFHNYKEMIEVMNNEKAARAIFQQLGVTPNPALPLKSQPMFDNFLKLQAEAIARIN